MRVVAIAVLFAGCAYQPGSFDSSMQGFPGVRATSGCLDVSVERRADQPDGAVVLGYAFGNRCDYPTPVDFSAPSVVARGGGEVVSLAAYDPDHQVRSLLLDGRAVGHEALAYPVERAGREIHDVCVDVGAIAHGPTSWCCFNATTTSTTEAL